jgi:hypothetical protein
MAPLRFGGRIFHVIRMDADRSSWNLVRFLSSARSRGSVSSFVIHSFPTIPSHIRRSCMYRVSAGDACTSLWRRQLSVVVPKILVLVLTIGGWSEMVWKRWVRHEESHARQTSAHVLSDGRSSWKWSRTLSISSWGQVCEDIDRDIGVMIHTVIERTYGSFGVPAKPSHPNTGKPDQSEVAT